MREISKFLLYASIFFSLAGCNNSDEQQTGISEDEILLGSSTALGGHASFLGTQYEKGSLAWFNEINAAGGIHGRKIRLISYNDRYDPPLTVENTNRLINNDEVFALFNYVGTPTSVKIIDIVNEANIPAFGFFTGAEALRTPFRPNMFHVRASYYQEAEGAIKYFVDDLGLKDIAVFYQDDAFGLAVLEGVNRALKRRNMQIADTATYIRGETKIKGAVKHLAKSNAQAVIMVGTYNPLAKFVKLSHSQRFFPYFHTVSFVGSKAYGLHLKVRGIQSSQIDKIIVTQVVPSPHANEEVIVSEYRELLKKLLFI
ncbi:MAG: ABC transporter substrate-binding protein, partial [Gammaproteobacteria bacterium]